MLEAHPTVNELNRLVCGYDFFFPDKLYRLPPGVMREDFGKEAETS